MRQGNAQSVRSTMKIDILGVKIDRVNLTEVLVTVERWIRNPGKDKHYIVTPNLEFILAAQQDRQFREILNKADLGLPDSSRLGLSYWLLRKRRLERLLLWPLFFFPQKVVMQFDIVTGTDFMEALCELSAEKGFTVGFLGGKGEVAKQAAERLKKKHPKLEVVFTESGGAVTGNGQSSVTKVAPADILFVAFGHIKQEKWIAKNLDKIPVKVAVGVGGAFDYLSDSVPRAPKWVRALGFEWLFRLVVQPWRMKRQLALFRYLWVLLFYD